VQAAQKNTTLSGSAFAFALLSGVLATACPIYDDGSDHPCAAGYQYDVARGKCSLGDDEPDLPHRCRTSSDCPDGQHCDDFLRCVPPAGGGSGEGGAAGERGGQVGSPIEGGASGDGAI
jgi:hypothetical protein